jgi:mannosylglycoprotein endo-beta-mannosidase
LNLCQGLKINYAKSEIFVIGGDKNIAEMYSSMFGCKIGLLPMTYLGMLVNFRNLRNVDLYFVDKKFVKKLYAWQGNAACSGGRLVLVDSSLSSLLSYVMSMTLLNKTFIEKVDTHKRRLFWHGKNLKKGYNMVSGPEYVDQKTRVVWALRI